VGGVLLKGGCVLSLDRQVGNLPVADVLIEDGVIADVGQGLRARDVEVVDATDTIVMPGFVDTHRHTWKTLLRSLGSVNGSADERGRVHGPDDVYAATLVGLLGAVEAGITTVVDWSDIQLDDRYTEAALQAHTDAGLRTVFVHAVPAWAGGAGDGEATLRRLASERTTAIGPRTTLAFGPPSGDRTELEGAATRWGWARELGLRIHVHVELAPSDRGVVAGLSRAGLLADDVTLVHASHLGRDDLDAIAAHDVGVAVAPMSEMVRGLGPLRVQELIDRGIRPGLAVDDQLLSPGDIFAQMHAIQSVQHAASFELKLAGKSGIPHLLSTRDVIRYATVDGAVAAGLGEVTGSLTPGKQADVVVLRADRPNIAPVNDPIGAVVWGMDASNVDWVFVGGRALMRDGELLADVARVRDLAVAARKRVEEASGRLVESGEGGSR
jgi:5-methylthioadenosine/S-adenosylhomocysteine deaminase